MCRVGQSHIFTPHITVYLVIFLPKVSFLQCIYVRFLFHLPSIFNACVSSQQLWACRPCSLLLCVVLILWGPAAHFWFQCLWFWSPSTAPWCNDETRRSEYLNLMVLTYYNMLPSIKVQDVYKGKHAPWLRGMRLKMLMQKTAMSRMLARSAHIPRGHHLNPFQQFRIAKHKTLREITKASRETTNTRPTGKWTAAQTQGDKAPTTTVMTYRTVRYHPLTLKIGQPLFGTTKRFALQELSMTHLMLLTICTITICKWWPSPARQQQRQSRWNRSQRPRAVPHTLWALDNAA